MRNKSEIKCLFKSEILLRKSGFDRWNRIVNIFYFLSKKYYLPWTISLALQIIFKSKNIILIHFVLNRTLGGFTTVVNAITICS